MLGDVSLQTQNKGKTIPCALPLFIFYINKGRGQELNSNEVIKTKFI